MASINCSEPEPFNGESVTAKSPEVTPVVAIANIETTSTSGQSSTSGGIPSTGKPPVADSNRRPHYQRRGEYRPHRGGYHNAPPIANNLIYRPASAMYYFPSPTQPFVDPVLHGKILNQINYYFSNDNLVKDLYLRRNMDEQGWVSVYLIAGFKKVSSMTGDVQIILHVMRSSTLVEVLGYKMRRRNDWRKWLLPPAAHDLLASLLQGIRLSSKRTPSSGELQERAEPV